MDRGRLNRRRLHRQWAAAAAADFVNDQNTCDNQTEASSGCLSCRQPSDPT